MCMKSKNRFQIFYKKSAQGGGFKEVSRPLIDIRLYTQQ